MQGDGNTGRKEGGRANSGDQANSHAVVDEKLDDHKQSVYIALVAGANYLSPGHPDLSFTEKELARGMNSPTRSDQEKMKRIAQYLNGRPRAFKRFAWPRRTGALSMCTDAGWAGDKRARKSTSGGCVMIGNHLLKSFVKTQSLIVLSSGESELYAPLRVASEGVGVQPNARDLGIELGGEAWEDASAAMGITKRRGLGKT